MTKHTKDLNRWKTQKFLLVVMAVLTVAMIILSYTAKDTGDLLAFAGIYFTFLGAFFGFNYNTKPKGDDDE